MTYYNTEHDYTKLECVCGGEIRSVVVTYLFGSRKPLVRVHCWMVELKLMGWLLLLPRVTTRSKKLSPVVQWRWWGKDVVPIDWWQRWWWWKV